MPHVFMRATKVGYQDHGGAGIPIVLVHAFPLDSTMWQGQIDALSGNHRFVTVDLQGFGTSDAPEDESGYSMGEFADQIKAVIDEIGADKVVLVGLSMGGYVAFEFWRRYRERVAALVLADTRAEADPPEGKDKRSAQQQQVREQGTSGLIEALTGALLGEQTRTNKPEVVDAAKKSMANPDAGFIGALEAMKNRPDSSEDLTTIDVPTLVIVGENDGVTPPEAARKIHEHVGGSQLVVIPEVGHLSNLEAPEDFNRALEDFLTQFK
ncbi:MAG: alpha/beta fold hydrolase [Actinomycetota bacterium]